MATRSLIGMANADGTISSIYCHWDGYPDGVGVALLTHYNSEDRARALVALGSRSSLGEDVNQGIYPDAEPASVGLEWPDAGQDYVYLWCEDAWHVHSWSLKGEQPPFQLLSSVVKQEIS